jgi:hypothetical protein
MTTEIAKQLRRERKQEQLNDRKERQRKLAEPSILTTAEKRKAARDRKKITVAALQRARANAFNALPEDTQTLIEAQIEDAISEYEQTMNAAEEEAYADLAGTLEGLALNYGYSIVMGAHECCGFAMEHTYAPPASVVFAELNELNDKQDSDEVKADAEALSEVGTVKAWGVEFPEADDEPDGGEAAEVQAEAAGA